MKARHLLWSAAASTLLIAAGASAAQAAPATTEQNSAFSAPEWSKDSFSMGAHTMKHRSTASGFLPDGTAYFSTEEVRLSPEGIGFTETSSHS
ncbi:hypothetical protein [Streptomyces luteocolor]|uniref:hypothetical protein n=1 Tax=Streptomyces luteocolor TaxID=285500 RepID=UPI000B240850|nr:hypothetical protein [Streptomyces luteocolor]